MIAPSLQEILKLKLAEILTTELDKELAEATGEYKEALESFYNTAGELNIFVDRFTPLDPSEMNGIVITPEKVLYEHGSSRKSQNSATYFVDVLGESYSTETEPGDEKTNRILQRINGVIVQIMQKGEYIRMDLEPGIVSSKKWIETMFYRPTPDTANYPNAVTSRLEIEYDEEKILKTPVQLKSHHTTKSGRYKLIKNF